MASESFKKKIIGKLSDKPIIVKKIFKTIEPISSLESTTSEEIIQTSFEEQIIPFEDIHAPEETIQAPEETEVPVDESISVEETILIEEEQTSIEQEEPSVEQSTKKTRKKKTS